MHTAIYKIINNDLLCRTGHSTQYSIIIYMGKESEKELTYVCVKLRGFPGGSAIRNLPAMQELKV